MILAIDTRISQQQMETLKQALLEVRLLIKCISPTQSLGIGSFSQGGMYCCHIASAETVSCLKIVMQPICRQGEPHESAVCATSHIQLMSVKAGS